MVVKSFFNVVYGSRMTLNKIKFELLFRLNFAVNLAVEPGTSAGYRLACKMKEIGPY